MTARSKTAVRAGIRTEPLLLRRNHRNSGRVLVSYRAVLHGRAFRPTLRIEPSWLEALKIVAAKRRVKVNDLLLEGAAHVLALNGQQPS